MSDDVNETDDARTQRLFAELAAVREKLADAQRRATRSRTSRVQVTVAPTSSSSTSQRPPPK